jgi:hypothetical protein
MGAKWSKNNFALKISDRLFSDSASRFLRAKTAWFWSIDVLISQCIFLDYSPEPKESRRSKTPSSTRYRKCSTVNRNQIAISPSRCHGKETEARSLPRPPRCQCLGWESHCLVPADAFINCTSGHNYTTSLLRVVWVKDKLSCHRARVF